MPNFKKEVIKAKEKVNPFINETPVQFSHELSKYTNGNIYFKMENWQKSGSFKIRGVLNKILSIPETKRRKQHFVAASTGNHAIAFAHAMHLFGLPGEVIVPIHVSGAKKRKIESMGMKCVLHGETSLETEIFTRKYALENRLTLVHPYNDWKIVFGQATIALEILKQLAQTDLIVVPIGGGGLIGGIASYAKSVNPNIRIIGVQPEQSPENV